MEEGEFAMEMHWVHPDVFDQRDREAAEVRIESLAEGHSDIIHVRVSAHKTAHHRHGGQEVHITAQVRGGEIVAKRSRPDAGLALNETVDVFEREVHKMRERRTDRRDERSAPPPELGIIDRVLLDDGYGFILTDGGDQVYFHRNALRDGLALDTLDEGQRVALDFEPGDQGPQAIFVAPAPPDAPGV